MKRAPALALSLLVATAVAAPGKTDLQAAATQTAQRLGGVLRSCPASFAGVGTPEKQCVGVADPVEAARLKLNAALPGNLYGVWRSRDGQRSVYNWLRTAGGYVYLRLQPDPDGRAQTLAYLDLPPEGTGTRPSPPAATTQIGGVVLSPAAPAKSPVEPPASSASGAFTAPPAAPAGSTAAPSRAPSRAPVPVVPVPVVPVPVAPAASPLPPLARTLGLQSRRLNGPDVLALQNRLIALMRPAHSGQGDGWYGPVTAQTVRAFQRAAGLPVTDVVDRATWTRLFSADAPGFDAPTLP